MAFDHLPANLREPPQLRAGELFAAQVQQLTRGADRLLMGLMLLEWLLGAAAAVGPSEGSLVGRLLLVGAGLGVAACALVIRTRQAAGQARMLAEQQAALETTNSASKLRSVFDSPMMGIGFWDLDGSVREANAALLRMAGYTADELHAGKISWTELTPPDQLPRMRQTLAEIEAHGVCVPYEREFLRKDGSRLSVMMSAAALRGGETYGVACLLDITERKRAEEALRRAQEQLRHVQKIEGIGRLASGIAHDFNNILAIVRGFAELIVEDPLAGDTLRDSGEEILHAVERGAALTGQLLAFSRKQVQAPTRLDLNAIIAETGAMLHRLIGRHVDLVLDLPVDAWIQADRSQIEQVILNLAINARDAMPSGGQVRIATSPVRLEAGHPDLAGHMSPGPYVLLTVSDTGCGMSDEVRKQVFEPFFTTKPTGKGTGMGLAIVYGIVTQTGGSIAVDSALGRGTVLRIYLPQQSQNLEGQDLEGQNLEGTSRSFPAAPAPADDLSGPRPPGEPAARAAAAAGCIELVPVPSRVS